MKIFSILSFLIVFLTIARTIPSTIDNDILACTSSCPPNHELAEKELTDYLGSDSTINELQTSYDMNLTTTSHTEIIPLEGESKLETCQKLNDLNSQWLKQTPNYSIYQVSKYYFIVTFSVDNKGEFERDSIMIIDENLEAVAFAFDF